MIFVSVRYREGVSAGRIACHGYGSRTGTCDETGLPTDKEYI